MSASVTSESPEKLPGGGQTATVGAGAGSGSEEGGEKATSTGNPSSVSPSSSQFQRLKVEDALSYLDQVKLQFGSQPQVYNDFLDIMKEFKSQSIDTPGVISRVSNLFKGHPDLIVGFNTFLPPGFKIEVHGQNEINIHGPAQHTQTLQQIAMRHNSQAQAAAAASRSAATTSKQSSQGNNSKSHNHQPVEFNHAINYVNKIKNRFQGQPDVYKAFLEILHTYQKEQRMMKDGNGPASLPIPLTETEVYGQVSKLFQNQEDLLSEFGQFLPDATASHQLASLMGSAATGHSKKQTLGKSKSHNRKSSQSGGGSGGSNGPPSKRMKSSTKDLLTEAGKHSSYSEMALFDKIRKCLNIEVYDNFLRCLVLFNEEIVSRHDLVQLITPFLGKYPDLFCQFKNLLGFKEPSNADLSPENTPPPSQFPNKDRSAEFAAEIDFNSLKRHGASYRALPKTYVQPMCSGRTTLCQEVLNDTWVSFPMWSEDSTFHGTRKTQYEEYIFRCEDERFELDIVLETNLSTIKVLEAVQKKMEKMSSEEMSGFTLTDSLGGFSETVHRKSIYRIYGEKAVDIIEGMKKNPAVGISPVLKRLKSKQEEWYEAQKQFNKIWREQLERYYLKSLDHQGINFKATDTRNMRSKSLILEVEALYDERQEQLMDGKTTMPEPHLLFNLPSHSTVHSDAVSLVIYYMKRASSLSKEDATKIKTFLTFTLSDFCYYERVTLTSDDDLSLESDSDNMEIEQEVKADDESTNGPKPPEPNKCIHPETPTHYGDLEKHTMFTNNTMYTFYRLFQFLWERLNKLYQQSLVAIEDGLINGGNSLQESVAVRLGLKKLPDIQVEDYYPTFLSMAKNYMEGNIDGATYEDTCREMFGVHAYLAFTLDRLVQNIVRQLHTVVADESCLKLMECYTSYVEGLTDTMSPSALFTAETHYQKKVEALLNDENCYKVVMNIDRMFSIELLESEESSEDNGTESKKYSMYVEQYCKDEPPSNQSIRQLLQSRKIFLKRNHRKPFLLASTISSPTSSEDNEKPDKDIDDLLMQFDTHGELEFKMDERTYRMIPLANSGDYLYKRNSLNCAKLANPAVFNTQKKRYDSWYSQWCVANHQDPAVQQQQCDQWFLGITGDNSVVTGQQSEEYNGHKRYRYTISPKE